MAVYDLADPRTPKFVQVLPVTNGPEGLLVIPKRDLLVVSSEVDVPEDNVRSTIGWGALSGLSRDVDRPNRLWTISDSYYAPTRLFSIRTRPGDPAVVRRALTLTEAGQPLGIDGEGIAARRAGGF